MKASAQLKEITVTANKREQSLQDVAISVAVIGADQIQRSGIMDLIDLQSAAPSLEIEQLQSSAQTNSYIRGFGNGANNPGIEPSVGIFIDGVPRTRAASALSDLPNLERVEVLSGPQSTLFGKNSSAGVISITTKLPEDELSGTVSAGVGNYGSRVLNGTVTGPISDGLSFRVSASLASEDSKNFSMSIGVKNAANGWDAMFWGRNLTDHETLISAFPTTAAPGSFSAYPNQPRTYGLTVRKSF